MKDMAGTPTKTTNAKVDMNKELFPAHVQQLRVANGHPQLFLLILMSQKVTTE